VLEPTKAKVFDVNKRLTGKLENRDPQRPVDDLPKLDER
jgi:hypothetical protein